VSIKEGLWENCDVENINLRFGNHLKGLRKKKKLTQEELAELSNLEYKYIQRLEGKRPSSPTLNSLEKLAKAFKTTVPKLVTFK
jgi:transcriptional regulator with XRE-family HTH domain